MSYLITPQQRGVTIILKALAPISHHDPAQHTKANTVTFLRRRQLVESHQTADIGDIQALVNAFPVPVSTVGTFSQLNQAEFLACAVVYAFLFNYNGQGLLDGTDRYARLQDRIKISAIKSSSLFAFWGDLCNSLQVGASANPRYRDETAMLLMMPPPVALLVLRQIVNNAPSVVMLSRFMLDAYKADKEAVGAATPTPIDTSSLSGQITLEVPTFSANSIRHELLREPSALHLLNALGLRFEDLPASVASLLYNGGDLNSSAPSDAFALARQIANAYPSLGLLGGSTDGFILGSSNVSVFAWLRCKENNDALNRYDLGSEVSAFDLLDQNEHTRHTTGRVDGSPMPYGFETLVQGSEIIARVELRPYASALEIGALGCALQTYVGSDETIGGQSAKGYGLMKSEFAFDSSLDVERAMDAYSDYLAVNRDSLRDGLLDGTLTTSKRVLS